jgi:hypothetical protein
MEKSGNFRNTNFGLLLSNQFNDISASLQVNFAFYSISYLIFLQQIGKKYIAGRSFACIRLYQSFAFDKVFRRASTLKTRTSWKTLEFSM